MDRTASHQTLPERSRLLNGRSPMAWQIELIDQVVWCSSATRTRLPQKNAVSAPCWLALDDGDSDADDNAANTLLSCEVSAVPSPG